MDSDEQLARQAQRGDHRALRTLVERFYPRMFRYVYRLGAGNRMLAEDMTQDVFVRMQRGLARYQYPRSFKTWMYAIATNRMRDHWALLDTQRTESADPDTIDIAGFEIGGEPTLIRQEEEARVRTALALLPEPQRQAIILYYYEELSQSDIAAVADVPLGTVKSRLFAGLRRLREMLEGVDL